jgi:hypothetical protein
MQPAAKRLEPRTPLKITVDLSSLDIHTLSQKGVTENVSPRGARVITTKAWKPNERLVVRSLLGDLRSRARIVYCERMAADAYVIGLELYIKAGEWTFPHPVQQKSA